MSKRDLALSHVWSVYRRPDSWWKRVWPGETWQRDFDNVRVAVAWTKSVSRDDKKASYRIYVGHRMPPGWGEW